MLRTDSASDVVWILVRRLGLELDPPVALDFAKLARVALVQGGEGVGLKTLKSAKRLKGENSGHDCFVSGNHTIDTHRHALLPRWLGGKRCRGRRAQCGVHGRCWEANPRHGRPCCQLQLELELAPRSTTQSKAV